MSIPTPQYIPENKRASQGFRIRRIIVLMFYIMALIGLLTFDPADIDYLASGLTGLSYPHNRTGALGAYFSWIMLASIGIATYPLMMMLLLCSLRRLLWRGGLQRCDWAYVLSVLVFALGCSFILGLNPPAVQDWAALLNISGFPGGVIGHHFCAPGSGWIFISLNTTGVVIISLTMIVISAGIVWHYDWQEPTSRLLATICRYWQKWHSALPSAPPPAGAVAAAAQTPAAATVPPQPAPEAAPDLNTFRTRRGEASVAAARAAEEAINGKRSAAPAAPPPQRQQPLLNFTVPASPPAPQTVQPATPPPPPPEPALAHGDAFGGSYVLPTPSQVYVHDSGGNEIASHQEVEDNIGTIQRALDDYKVDAEVSGVVPGPQITLYEISFGPGELINRLTALRPTLTMYLKAQKPVRIIPNIPGKSCSGIEVPNRKRQIVSAYDLFESREWQCSTKTIPLMLGKNITGERVMLDLAAAPHLLVAGATGTGKSVCVNMMIQSMLLRFSPEELRLILVDPKFMEFTMYSSLPHLLTPVINDPQKVGLVLRWAVTEMNRRCQIIALTRTKNLEEFNHRPARDESALTDADGNPIPAKLPYIVIVIDELADIMVCAKKEVEPAIQMLAQKARAAGIHLILSTQRPDKNVVTGVIKSNFPVRIALTVTDAINSRVILDMAGAETLLGRGDMLYKSLTSIERIQGGLITNEECEELCRLCSSQAPQIFDASIAEALEARDKEEALTAGGGAGAVSGAAGDEDSGLTRTSRVDSTLVQNALELLLRNPKKSPTISFFQSELIIGYQRSKRLVNDLEQSGYIGPLLNERTGEREIYWENFPGYGSQGGQADAPASATDTAIQAPAAEAEGGSAPDEEA